MRRALSIGIAIAALSACGGDKSVAPNVTPPVADSINPGRGTVGTVVRLMGTGFSDSAHVFFNAIPSPKVERQGAQLYVTAPDGLTLGTTYDIRVMNRDGGADTLAAAFRVVSPSVSRVNGVTKPTGLTGMTVLIEGDAFGDARHGKVFFAGAGGVPIQATIADSANDWTNSYIVTTVPSGTANASQITVQTATGTSAALAFNLISGSTFSPSVINWTQTSALPQPLQGLGAVFLPPANTASNPANYVFTVGGAADQSNVATTVVYRAQTQQSGALSAWSPATTALPDARAYHTTVAASAYTAALDTTTTEAYLYVLGGIDGSGATVSTVYYSKVSLDGSNGPWLTTTALPAALHSASAVVFRGYVYLAGGADGQNVPTKSAWRAAVNSDGTLGAWQPLTGLTNGAAFQGLVNFGPYLYAVGGDGNSVAPSQATTSGGEMSAAFLSRVNLRTGDLATAWSPIASMSKGRSKHNTVVGGGFLFTTSGVYSGQAGSSENTYTQINADGTIGSWNGATGTNTISTLLGYDLYNEAAIGFVDASGKGHVLVLGGAKRGLPGRASAAVVYY
ncbi:MAG TPA: hypothetical protein VGP95_21725 [Gemmatimonadaceae bacterium]|nr:hypothetical protein [Gemmatimonadaceae bacterium]